MAVSRDGRLQSVAQDGEDQADFLVEGACFRGRDLSPVSINTCCKFKELGLSPKGGVAP